MSASRRCSLHDWKQQTEQRHDHERAKADKRAFGIAAREGVCPLGLVQVCIPSVNFRFARHTAVARKKSRDDQRHSKFFACSASCPW